jgi:hypothetical protein
MGQTLPSSFGEGIHTIRRNKVELSFKIISNGKIKIRKMINTTKKAEEREERGAYESCASLNARLASAASFCAFAISTLKIQLFHGLFK